MPETETDSQKTSAETTEEIRKQIELVNIALMDKMKTSVSENGEFFLEVGLESTITQPYENTLALIFKKGRVNHTLPGGDNVDYIVMTRNGMKIITMKERDMSKQVDKVTGGFFGGTNTIALDTNRVYQAKDSTPEDEDFIKTAISDSIRVAKENSAAAKNKQALEAEQQKLAAAKQLSDFFDQFNQPSTSSTPGQTT